MLGGILLSIHNLHFLIDLMGKAREAVLAGEYETFYQDWMNSPAANDYYRTARRFRSQPLQCRLAKAAAS